MVDPAVLEQLDLVASGPEKVMTQILDDNVEVAENFILEAGDVLLQLGPKSGEVAFAGCFIRLRHTLLRTLAASLTSEQEVPGRF
jgi:hypothetical protein